MFNVQQRKKENLNGKIVVSSLGKKIGKVSGISEDSFYVEKRFFGVWPTIKYQWFTMEYIDKVNATEILLLPTNDEYWRLPNNEYYSL